MLCNWLQKVTWLKYGCGCELVVSWWAGGKHLSALLWCTQKEKAHIRGGHKTIAKTMLDLLLKSL